MGLFTDVCAPSFTTVQINPAARSCALSRSALRCARFLRSVTCWPVKNLSTDCHLPRPKSSATALRARWGSAPGRSWPAKVSL